MEFIQQEELNLQRRQQVNGSDSKYEDISPPQDDSEEREYEGEDN
jgi:hypothetical protein